MKGNSISRFDWLELGVIVFMLIATLLPVTTLLYEEAQNQGIAAYQRSLDAHVERPFTKNLNEIREGLHQWMASYEAYKVPASYTNVYKEVESALAKANALSESVPTSSSPDFLRDLGALRAKVQAISPISAKLYGERNPWFPNFLIFTVLESFKIIGVFLIMGIIGSSPMWLADRIKMVRARGQAGG